MYTKNLNHKMTLRLDDELYEFLNLASDTYHITPSDYIRQCLGTVKVCFDKAMKAQDDMVSQAIKEGLENGIDRKTTQHDIL